MKIGLIGFGKTGKAVASVVLQNTDLQLDWVLRQSHVLEHRSVPEFLGIASDESGLIYSTASITIEALLDKHPVDVIIDFSSANAVNSYGQLAADRGIKIISAISHYGDAELRHLKNLSKQTCVFWSPNITVGVNYLMFAAKFLRKIAPGIDIEIVEEHFKGKNGVSGTAMKIADALGVNHGDIRTVRAGGIVGKHEIIFGFPHQTVRLVHESISREAFGKGVVFVAQNLVGKAHGFYNFEDILLPYFAS